MATSTIVIDLSSANMIEAGMAGEQEQRLQINRSTVGSDITDMAQFENDLRKTFSQLGVNSQGCNVLMSEHIWAPKLQREKLATLMFEAFGIQGFYLVPDALLALYAIGKPTGTVVICNAEETTIVPCYQFSAYLGAVGRVKQGSDFSVEEAIYSRIAICDGYARPDLFGNIIVIGDNVPPQSTVQAWQKEVSQLAPLTTNVQATIPANYQSLPWRGGSIVAASPSMDSLWFTKAEYESYGPTFIHRKCAN
jgi:actin-related protein